MPLGTQAVFNARRSCNVIGRPRTRGLTYVIECLAASAVCSLHYHSAGLDLRINGTLGGQIRVGDKHVRWLRRVISDAIIVIYVVVVQRRLTTPARHRRCGSSTGHVRHRQTDSPVAHRYQCRSPTWHSHSALPVGINAGRHEYSRNPARMTWFGH